MEDGKHLADYTCYTIEECLDYLSNITWIFFSTRGKWGIEQAILYTENWFGKSTFGLNMEGMMFHNEFGYAHHPELLKLTSLDSIFKLIQTTILKEYDSLEKAIEITNDLNRDLEPGEAFVTEAGIMKDDQAECHALIGRIAVEIDLNSETLDGLKGVKMPDRNIKDPKYNRIFDETARRLYKIIVSRKCPKSVRVM